MRRFLVIQLARLGDLVQTCRLVDSLALPEAGGERPEVHLCVDRSTAAMARLLYPRAVVHELRAHAGDGDQAAVARENLAVFAQLAGLGFEAVYNLNFSGLAFALARLFPARVVKGYASVGGQSIKSRWSELAFRWARRRGPWALNLVDLWAALAPRLVSPIDVNPAATPKGGGLGVVMAGRSQRRSLPPEVLARAAHAAHSRLGGRITLLGTRAEAGAAQEVLSRLPVNVREKARDLCGRTDLAGLAEVVGGLDLLLTPDTGAMHLAARLGTPVTACFLSSAWCWETGPYGAGHTVWQAFAPCAPCLESRPCDRDVACLAPFASREFLRLLSGKGGEPPQGLTGLASRLDGLGVDYLAFSGAAPFANERARLRTFLTRHLGLEGAGSGPDAELAEALYLERDWMTKETGNPMGED